MSQLVDGSAAHRKYYTCNGRIGPFAARQSAFKSTAGREQDRTRLLVS